MSVEREFDIDMEVGSMCGFFAQIRRGGGEWAAMAILHNVDGTVTPAVLAVENSDLVTEGVARLIWQAKATRVMVVQDAYWNTATDLDEPGYLRPSEDPFASEVMVVMFVTLDDIVVRTIPYRLEVGEVCWQPEHDLTTGRTTSRMAPVLQRALRRVAGRQ
jgi:hypothetical protein